MVCVAATTLTINSSTLQHFELFIRSFSLPLPRSISFPISLSCSCCSCSFCLCSHCQFAFCSIYSDALTLHFGPTFRVQLASSRTHTHTHSHSYTYIYIYRLCWLFYIPPLHRPFLFGYCQCAARCILARSQKRILFLAIWLSSQRRMALQQYLSDTRYTRYIYTIYTVYYISLHYCQRSYLGCLHENQSKRKPIRHFATLLISPQKRCQTVWQEEGEKGGWCQGMVVGCAREARQSEETGS